MSVSKLSIYPQFLSGSMKPTLTIINHFRKRNRMKLFDPFFKTKSVGEGTGLGLSIVMGILSDHNAEVEVETEEGIGTEFIIRFPL